MDAVSFAASIVGFASLVIQLSQISVDYASKVSSASKAQAAYIQELVVLQSVLKKYEDAATIDDLKNITGNWNAPISTTVMDSYKRQLEKVKTKLEKNLTRDSSFSGLKSFTWPFQDSEMARVVELLHRIRGILHSSLSADNLWVSTHNISPPTDSVSIQPPLCRDFPRGQDHAQRFVNNHRRLFSAHQLLTR